MRIITGRRVWIAAACASLFLCVLLVHMSLTLQKERNDLRTRQEELSLLKTEFQRLKGAVSSFEGKKSLMKVEGIVQAVDEVFGALGLNQKVKSVKPMGTRDKKYAVEEEAEVQVEKVSMNELVNIFYKIENVPLTLTIKKTVIKTSFDTPGLLNLTITVGLITPK
jgi:general secretion pathway protein M